MAPTGSVSHTASGSLSSAFSLQPSAFDSASWLVPAIDRILHEDGNDERLKIDGIAVIIGPGSFTGVRIGVATAKGLGYALGVQIAGVISLDALAADAFSVPSGSSGLVCPIMDAMRGEVYAAFYEQRERKERISEYMLIKPEDLAQKILENQQPVTLLGDGLMLWKEFFAKRLPGMVSFAPSHNLSVNAATIGMKMLLEGKGKSPEEVVPLYLRASNAETQNK